MRGFRVLVRGIWLLQSLSAAVSSHAAGRPDSTEKSASQPQQPPRVLSERLNDTTTSHSHRPNLTPIAALPLGRLLQGPQNRVF